MVRSHTVVAGETLSALASRFYGDAELDWLIASASGIAAPTTRSSVSTATETNGSSWSPAPVRTRSTGSTA